MKVGMKVRYTGKGGFKMDRSFAEYHGIVVDDVLTVDAISYADGIQYLAFSNNKFEHNADMFEEVK